MTETLRIDTRLDIRNADRDLARLKEKIRQAQEQLARQAEKKTALEAELDDINAAAVKAYENLKKLKAQQEALKGSGNKEAIAANKADIRDQEQYIRQLEREGAAVEKQIAATDSGMLKARESIADMETKAGGLEQKLSGSSEALAAAHEAISGIGKRIAGLAKRVLFFSVITKLLNGLKNWFGKALQKSEQFRKNLASLKGALLTIIQPIMSILLPAIEKLVGWIAKGLWYLAYFVARLSGKTINQLSDEAKALNDVSDAAKDAEKSLASFDEIQQLTGGGTNKESETAAPSFDVPELDANVTAWIDDLTLGIKNIIPDFGGLTSTSVTDAVLLGLKDLTTIAAGFAIGGVPGAITAAVSIVVLDLIFSRLKMTGNPQNAESIKDMVVSVLNTMVGFALGLKFFKSLSGGLETGSIAAAITVAYNDLKQIQDASYKTDEQKQGDRLAYIMGALAGGIGAFEYIGVPGIAFGLTVGAKLFLGIKELLFNDILHSSAGVLDKIIACTNTLIGTFAIAGTIVAGPIGGVVGAVLGLTVGAVLTLVFGDLQFQFDKDAVLTEDELPQMSTEIKKGVSAANFDEKTRKYLESQGVHVSDTTDTTYEFQLGKEVLKKGSKPQSTFTKTFMNAYAGKLPGFASGAVIPANHAFLAVLGDQKSGTNVEAPLATIEQALRNVLGSGAGSQTVILQVDKTQLGKVVYDLNKEQTRRIGVSLAEG